MNRDQKSALVEELAEEIRGADTIFAVDYRGISVSEIAELRSRLRDAGARFRIVKNSLTERASDKAGTESLKELLEGPTALTFVGGDAALAAKALNDQARVLGTLEFKGGLMNGAALSADEIRSIARLPARDVLHGQLVGVISSPVTGLVRTLNALISGLAIQLGQVAEQGLVSGEAPSSSDGEGGAASAAEAVASAAPDASSPTDSHPASEADDAASAPEPETEPEAEAAEAPAEVAEEPAAEQTDETESEASGGDAEEAKEEA